MAIRRTRLYLFDYVEFHGKIVNNTKNDNIYEKEKISMPKENSPKSAYNDLKYTHMPYDSEMIDKPLPRIHNLSLKLIWLFIYCKWHDRSIKDLKIT